MAITWLEFGPVWEAYITSLPFPQTDDERSDLEQKLEPFRVRDEMTQRLCLNCHDNVQVRDISVIVPSREVEVPVPFYHYGTPDRYSHCAKRSKAQCLEGLDLNDPKVQELRRMLDVPFPVFGSNGNPKEHLEYLAETMRHLYSAVGAMSDLQKSVSEL